MNATVQRIADALVRYGEHAAAQAVLVGDFRGAIALAAVNANPAMVSALADMLWNSEADPEGARLEARAGRALDWLDGASVMRRRGPDKSPKVQLSATKQPVWLADRVKARAPVDGSVSLVFYNALTAYLGGPDE